MSSPKQVSFFGGSVWGNRGAEAMLMTTIAQIRKAAPDTEFNVYTIYPDEDARLVKDEKIHFWSGKPLTTALYHFPLALLARFFRFFRVRLRLPKGLDHLRGSACLLDIGGITFADGRVPQLLYNIFTIWPAMLLGVPVIKLSQAMGPFKTSLNRSLGRKFIPKCEHTFARGSLTAEYLRSIEIPEDKVTQAADIAFLYEPEYSLSHENEEAAGNLAERLLSLRQEGYKVIGIVPSSLVLKKSRKLELDYAGKLINLVLSVGDEKVHFVFLPNGTRASSEKTMNNDIIAIREVRKLAQRELPEEANAHIDWVDYDINTCSVRRIIVACDALVTSRFHAMVAGLALCVPTMVIGWSHKYRETLADFGMEKYAVDYKNENINILRLFKEFLSENEIIREQLLAKIPSVRQSSSIQFDYLKSRLF
ncbi:MAG: polysaccharide pyruvyl transferase family protein [Anaerolineaceae bacterium]